MVVVGGVVVVGVPVGVVIGMLDPCELIPVLDVPDVAAVEVVV